MATTSPRKLRLLPFNDLRNPAAEMGTPVMGFRAKILKLVLKTEAGPAAFGGDRSFDFERIGLVVGLRITVLDEERENVLGI